MRALRGRVLRPDALQLLEAELAKLGARAPADIAALGAAAEAAPPRHVPYDARGTRGDRIELSDAWRQLKRIAAGR